MPVELEGGCRVTELREGEPLVREGVRIWCRFGRASGARAITLRIVEFAPGRSPGLRTPACDEVLYVLSGRGTIYLDGRACEIDADTGIYARPGTVLTVDNPGPDPLVLASSQCPDPEVEPDFVDPLTEPRPGVELPSPPPLLRLTDRPADTTGDRWYRVMLDADIGSKQVTQFVGAIPPGRAPDHFHDYEEVLCILRGQGEMWAGTTHTPISPGSCIFLPRQQIHCVENTGDGELRLLGVFYPAGSPAGSHGPD